MLNPIIPHISEEIWQNILEHNRSISFEKWPTYDENKLSVKMDTMEIPVQINGKLKAVVKVSKTLSNDDIVTFIKNDERIRTVISGKEIVKEIYIPNKLLNIVVK